VTTSTTSAGGELEAALKLLTGQFHELSAGVAEGRYVLWIGSGISRNRVEDVKGMILRALRFLQSAALAGAANHADAVLAILAQANLSSAELSSIDLAVMPDDWVRIDDLLGRLESKYSRVLDVEVEGEEPDYILWNGVDVVGTFGHPGSPDCEHFSLAILAAEGVASDLVSANWDPMIEEAVEHLVSAADSLLSVCASSSDLRFPHLGTQLLKFHGCARKAITNELEYRKLLIARYSQITSWRDDPAARIMRQRLEDLAATRPTLMLGLSAQDIDIQQVFTAAQAAMGWTWPSHPPAHIFADVKLGDDHINILKNVYKEQYSASPLAIKVEAQFPTYARPLLVALVVTTLLRKMKTLARLPGTSGLGPPDYDRVDEGLDAVQEVVGQSAGSDLFEFIKAFIFASTRLNSAFTVGRLPPDSDLTYRPLTDRPTNELASRMNVENDGLRELALVLSLLGNGVKASSWKLETVPAESSPQPFVKVTTAAGTSRVLLIAAEANLVRLELAGCVDRGAPDVVIIQSETIAPTSSRSPSPIYGRTSTPTGRHISVRDLLDSVVNYTDLDEQFRLAVAL
jgi:hypothetical protein